MRPWAPPPAALFDVSELVSTPPEDASNAGRLQCPSCTKWRVELLFVRRRGGRIETVCASCLRHAGRAGAQTGAVGQFKLKPKWPKIAGLCGQTTTTSRGEVEQSTRAA